MNTTIHQTVANVFEVQDWKRWGWTPLSKPLSIDVYSEWIVNGHHAQMTYLKDHFPLKADPKTLRPRVQSAFVVAEPYYPHPWPADGIPTAGVALYARGQDYHYQLKSKLERVCERLRESFPAHDFFVFTDSAPILERDLAYRASLGWFGKNTCLIDRKAGSLFFIAEILTTMEFQSSDEPSLSQDFCGTCTKCMEVCPTKAITAERVLDSNKCISYWTIESSEVPPEELRAQFGGWIFGCDLCQTVCPWNIKLHGKELRESHLASRDDYVRDLGWILRSSSKSLQRELKGTPLSRAAGAKLKRNALIAVANEKVHELTEEVSTYKDHHKLGDLANWTLQKLSESEKVEP